MKKGRLSLGLDISTQGISAVVLDIDTCTKVCEHSLDYCKDSRLNIFGIREEDYILPPENEGEASQPPELYFASMDAIFSELADTISLKDVAIVNNSSQQHGHVYLNNQAHSILHNLTNEESAESDLTTLLKGSLAYHHAPVWMTSDTAEQAEHIRNSIGGKKRAVELSGSNIPLRFTGVVVRRIAGQYPEVYSRTDTIHLISSLVAAVLTGNSEVPLDYGNACGMALMDYKQKSWSEALIGAVSGGLPGGGETLLSKLPPIVAPDAVVGTIAPYFLRKYGFLTTCQVVAGSGDNPQSKVLVSRDLLSLGTSIVNMVATDGKTFDMNGYANAMYDGTGGPFIFGCRTNGAMVWDRLRALYGLKKDEYGPAEKTLRQTPVGQNMVFWQPRNESFPLSGSFPMVRCGNEKPGLGTDYSGLIEATLASVYYHSRNFTRETGETLYVTGGARKSPEILRRVAAIWNRPVTPIDEGGAALGAAVAGACAFLKSEGNPLKTEQYAGENLLGREQVVQPRQEDVLAFHRTGGYLQKFAIEEAKLIS